MKLTYKAFLLGLFFPALMSGQETGLLRMASDRPARETEAALWGGVQEGRFKPTHAAVFQWSAGADAKTVRHGKTSSWTGTLSFEQTTGLQMSSSMLLEPDYYPFDILEFPRGMKSRQDVSLEAGFLSDLGYEWAAGLEASFKGAHVGKRDNVPHSSIGLDAKIAPVVTYVMDDDMGLVSSYFVRFRTENLKATESVSDLFLDEGLRYGTYQALGGNGAFPVRELSHGLSEMLYAPEASIGFDIAWKRGQAGGKDCGQFKFPGSTISAFYQQTVLADEVDHTYRISYKRQRDQLRETGTDSGFRSLSDRRERNLGLKYEARFVHGMVKNAGIALDGSQWKERAMWVGDQVLRYTGTAKAFTAMSFGPVDLDVNFLLGKGWWKDRGKAGQEGAAQSGRLTDDWLKKMEYLMASHMGMGGSLTGHISSNLYVQLYAYWYHAFNTTLLGGKNREIATLKVGYKF